MKKKLAAVFVAAALALGACAFGACAPETVVGEKLVIESANIVVRGYEWGPMVDAVVVKFDGKVSGVTKDTFTVKTSGTSRKVLNAYCSDEKGVKSEKETEYVTLELERASITSWGANASPFEYQNMNKWSTKYTVNVTVAEEVKIGNAVYAPKKKANYNVNETEHIVPQTESWKKDTVNYKGKNFTGKDVDITLQRASWAPEGAATDSGKNPLVIWLHGAGEGGTDIDIDLLGNEVTALTTENETNIQHYFTKDGLKGAYVLAVQTPTAWMDQDGNGTYNHTDASATTPQESWYTEALWKAITTYVDGNSDIDTNRIYLGGCSNGGYMTMNMMFKHGDYFAAYYPCCEAYVDARISEEMLAQVKDYAVWFVLSNDDRTVAPNTFEKPTFTRLMQAGAQNIFMTMYEHVVGTDSPGTTYDGHWSWIYIFNDAVKTCFDNSKVTDAAYLTPANCTQQKNMWEWLASQKKANA